MALFVDSHVPAQRKHAGKPFSLGSVEPLMKAKLEQAAAAFFCVYHDQKLERAISSEINRLPGESNVTVRPRIYRLVRPLVDASEDESWDLPKRTAILRLHNLVVESRYLERSGKPPLGEIANFDKVSSMLYRGGQPTREGFGWLVKHGIKTVVTFREKDCPDVDLESWPQVKRIQISMNDKGIPTIDQVERFIGIVDNPRNGPVFAHCLAGIGRTGIMIACWRIAHGSSAEEAVNEALSYPVGGQSLPPEQLDFVREFGNYWRMKKNTSSGCYYPAIMSWVNYPGKMSPPLLLLGGFALTFSSV